MVTWLWASSASADESAENASGTETDPSAGVIVPAAETAPAEDFVVPSPSVEAPTVAPLAELVDGTVDAVVTPAVEVVDPVVEVVDPVVEVVAATVDTAARPLLEATEPAVAPVIELARPALAQVVAPVVAPVVDRVAPVVVGLGVDRVVAPASAVREQPLLEVAPPAPPLPAPTSVVAPSAPRAASPAFGLRRSFEHDFSSPPTEMPAASGAATEIPQPELPRFPQQSPRPLLATHSAPTAPSSLGGRDLGDSAHHAWALATVAHSAMPAVGVEARPRTVGASENSGSRPAFTPD